MPWLALVAIALTVGIPIVLTLLSAVVRRPRVVLRFEEDVTSGGNKVLVGSIANEPITTWPLSYLGLRRSAVTDVFCWIVIHRVADGSVVAVGDPHLHGPAGEVGQVVDIAAGIATATLEVASMDVSGAASCLDRGGIRQLRPDNYIAEVILHPGELGMRTIRAEFLVGIDQDRFRWLKQS